MKQEDMIEFIDNDVDELNYFKNVFMSKSRIKDVLSTEYDNLDAKHRYFGTIVMYEIYMELVPANNGNKLFCINMAFRQRRWA